MNKKNTVYTVGSIGSIIGLAYAFNKKKGFLGYVGFFFLGGILGSLVGGIIASNMKEETTTTDTITDTKPDTTTTTQNATKQSVGDVSVSPITPKGVSQSDIESILKK
jgi:putative exporter of polyketide antibiotics